MAVTFLYPFNVWPKKKKEGIIYFTFNNTVPTSARIHAKENIPDDFIISSEYEVKSPFDRENPPVFYEPKEYVVDFRANTDYYFTMCSIDAHGISSNYSAQYRIRRNNVTGEFTVSSISAPGAPKAYPNLLIPGKLVQPSFSVSGFNYMDVYFAPDSTLSVPNLNEDSVNIQFFELETEIEKNITIKLATLS